MESTKKEEYEDQEALLMKGDRDDSFLEKGSRDGSSVWRRPFRLILEIVMALMIVALLIRPYTNLKSIKPSPVPDFPRKTYTFQENHLYLHENMFNSKEDTLVTLHNWIELSADGRGYVKVEDAESYDLGEPYSMQINDTFSQPVYMMSNFHQLHCLSYLAETLSSAINTPPLPKEVLHHSAHCFDYIRQAIMCNADTSLEGKTETPGWGSKHQCKDYEKILKWANERTVVPYRRNMPDEAVL